MEWAKILDILGKVMERKGFGSVIKTEKKQRVEKEYKIARKWLIAFVILLVLQFAYMLYWGNAKEGYYVDEFFTFDNAHYISQSTPDRLKLYDSIIEYDKWVKLRDIKSTLTVTREESLFQDSLFYNVKKLVNGQPYMVFMNYVEAIFFDGVLSKWSGISLNLIFYVLSQILIYKIAKRITKSDLSAFWAAALYGFSGIAISMVIYVRLYVLANLWVLCFLYLHFLMWEEIKWQKNIVYEFIAALVLIFAYGNSPLPIIAGAGIIIAFTIMLFAKRKWRQMCYYLIPYGVGGLLYAYFFTDYLDIFMHPQQAAEGQFNVATASLMNNFLNLTSQEAISRIAELMTEINDFLFSHIFILIIYVVLFVVGFGIRVRKGQHNKNQSEIFGYVVVGFTIFFFSVASVCFGLGAIRYNSFLFPLFSIFIMCIISNIGKENKGEKILCAVLTVLVVASIGFTATVPRIENLYADDKIAVNAVKECKGIPSVVVDYGMDDRVMYECLAYADEEAPVIFMKADNMDIKASADKIMVWQTVNKLFEVEEQLKEAGYIKVELIAQTHESLVYICER